MKQERPFIVRFENQIDVQNFDVVIQHPDVEIATKWAIGYFGPVKYLHSEGNQHTYRRKR